MLRVANNIIYQVAITVDMELKLTVWRHYQIKSIKIYIFRIASNNCIPSTVITCMCIYRISSCEVITNILRMITSGMVLPIIAATTINALVYRIAQNFDGRKY